MASVSKYVLAYVLDDDPGMLKLVGRILSLRNISSRHFTTVEKLSEAMKVAVPDFLVLDLVLGGVDAIDIIRKLDEMKYAGRILLISGRDETTLENARRIGVARGLSMMRPLTKPFFAADLLERVDEQVPIVKREAKRESSAIVSVDALTALERGWMTLWYQPKFSVANRLLVGAEALIRLIHPELGVVPPQQFLPAIGTEAMYRISEFVLVSAIADWRRLSGGGRNVKISVNMPVSVISNADFVRLIREALPSEPSFPGLVVELTEDEVIADVGLISEVAMQLRLCGVGLSIDDVGTAHSGLSRFLDLPFVEVKIDRRFVDGCSRDEGKRTLCKMVVDLAHHFGAVACGEGVEEEADLSVLADIECDQAQGFLLGRPMDLKAFVESRWHQ